MTPPVPDGFRDYGAWLRRLPEYRDQIASSHFLPPRRAVAAATVPEPYEALARRLDLALWRHQAQALAHVREGQDVVVSTPTASGKSWVYRLPVLEAAERGGTALLAFPTKALAHDQLTTLAALGEALGVEGFARYDGDTPRSVRAEVRAHARAVVTNPDMLHHAILPFHGRWADFLRRLEVVVVDELHTYRGVLGSHVGNVLRRLLRLAAHYGARPTVIAASATIANPGELFTSLTGRSAAVVDDDAAPHGPREFVFWEPPAVPGGDGRRRSANAEAADLAAAFVRSGVRSLFFCNSRKGAELLRRYAGARLSDEEREALSSYRAGYTLDERRHIEEGFRAGRITVLTATSALELGMDVGGVDAVVMVGYPGSSMSFWQRAGRAGRGGERSLAALIPGNDPLDEHYLRHPEVLVDGRVEAAVADAFNREIHPRHVVCAAAEWPLAGTEELVSPELDLDATPGLVRNGDRWASVRRHPHGRLGLRGDGGGRVRLRTLDGRRLGEATLARAYRELHPGAVHLHGGEPYLVTRLDAEAGVVELVPHIEDWYTQVRSDTHVEILEALPPDRSDADPILHWGRVRVVEQIHGYVRKRYRTETVLEERALDLPEQSYPTQALWFSAAPVADAVATAELPSALHALEHALIGLLPAFVACERADVGGVSYPAYPGDGDPRIFIYDGAPGGVGYARAGVGAFRAWLGATLDLLRACPCTSGCPRCVLSPKCGNGNQYLDKAAAATLGEALARRLDVRLPHAQEGIAPPVLE